MTISVIMFELLIYTLLLILSSAVCSPLPVIRRRCINDHLLLLLLLLLSHLPPRRDRREIKARIEARRAGLDLAQQHKQPVKSPCSRGIVIIHDGAREERIKMGQYNSMKRRVTFTRENVAFMIHTIPGSNVDPNTGQERRESSDPHQTSVDSDSSGTSSGDAARKWCRRAPCSPLG